MNNQCPHCNKKYTNKSNAIDSIILYGACPSCHKGSWEVAQEIMIHNYNRIYKNLSEEECLAKVESFRNDPERLERNKFAAGDGFFGGCGSCSGGCSSCG